MLRFYCKILQKAIEQRQNFRLRRCTFSGYQKILHYLDNYVIHSKEDSHSPTPQRVKPAGMQCGRGSKILRGGWIPRLSPADGNILYRDYHVPVCKLPHNN